MMLPPMQELQAFQKVAEYLSFKKAAEAMSMTPSTLSHLIRALEGRVQTRLFNRTTRSVSLTDAGHSLYIKVNLVLGELTQAFDDLHIESPESKGNIRISVNEVAAPILLQKLGSKLKKHYPKISMELIVENHLIDIVAEGFDAGVRLHNVIPLDMIAVPIIRDFRFVTVASKDYIQASGIPNTPEDLLNHNCIGFRFKSGRIYEWEFEKDNSAQTIDAKGGLTTNSPALLIQAAKQGLGIAMVAESMIRKELEDQELQIVLEEWTNQWPDLCLYFPKNRYMPAALRTVIDLLSE